MNGAVFDATFNVFFKFRYDKVYEGVLSTPLGPFDIALGEIGWAVLRGSLYSVGFFGVMAAMGLVTTPWAVLVIPVAVLVSFAFAVPVVGLPRAVASDRPMSPAVSRRRVVPRVRGRCRRRVDVRARRLPVRVSRPRGLWRRSSYLHPASLTRSSPRRTRRPCRARRSRCIRRSPHSRRSAHRCR